MKRIPMETKSKTKDQRLKIKAKKYIYAVGRRKEATARVYLFKGKDQITVNGQPIDRYFPGEVMKVFYLKPLQVTNTLGKYTAEIKVRGSGKSGQLQAVVHGISRALDKENKELYHSSLKSQKLLTRDSRTRERRKAGQMGRARKKKQSPKR